MTPRAGRALDIASRNATCLIFAAVLLWFGLQAPGFLMPESLAGHRHAVVLHRDRGAGGDLRPSDRGIDLSEGSLMFLAPLIAGIAMRAFRLSVPEGFTAALLAAVAMGVFDAVFIVILRVIPFIVTLATLFLFRGFGTSPTRSTQFDFPDGTRRFGLSSVPGVPLPIVVFAAVALAAHVVLAQTTFGRQACAFGNDPEATRKSGGDIRWVQARVCVICAVCAAIAGFVMISQIGRLDVAFGAGHEFDVIAAVLGGACLMGGTCTAFGAVVGATLIQTVGQGQVFTGGNLYLQPVLMGAIISRAVLVDRLRDQRLQARPSQGVARGVAARDHRAAQAGAAQGPVEHPAGPRWCAARPRASRAGGHRARGRVRRPGGPRGADRPGAIGRPCAGAGRGPAAQLPAEPPAGGPLSGRCHARRRACPAAGGFSRRAGRRRKPDQLHRTRPLPARPGRGRLRHLRQHRHRPRR